jgi:hypothetical protein
MKFGYIRQSLADVSLNLVIFPKVKIGAFWGGGAIDETDRELDAVPKPYQTSHLT